MSGGNTLFGPGKVIEKSRILVLSTGSSLFSFHAWMRWTGRHFSNFLSCPYLAGWLQTSLLRDHRWEAVRPLLGTLPAQRCNKRIGFHAQTRRRRECAWGCSILQATRQRYLRTNRNDRSEKGTLILSIALSWMSRSLFAPLQSVLLLHIKLLTHLLIECHYIVAHYTI